MLEIVAAVLGAAALGPWVVKLFRAIERRYQAGDDAKWALLEDESRHADHELVDIRSNVLSPNELVATLCVTCDAQLSPKLWQDKLDRELAALEGPDPHAETNRSQHSLGELEKLGFRYTAQSKIGGSHNVLAYFACKRNPKHEIQLIFSDKDHLKRFRRYSGFGGLWQGDLDHAKFGPELNPKYSASDVYVQVAPAIPAIDIKPDTPKNTWSADDYRRRGWTTEILESNFDHSQQKYILPLFQRARPGRVNRLTFLDKAEATHWWGSCIPYDDFIAGRRTVKRGAGGIRSFSAGGVTETFRRDVKRAITAEEEKLSDQISRLTGIPPHLVGRMSAAQAADALNQASLGDVDEVEIRAWGVEEPIIIKRVPRGSWG